MIYYVPGKTIQNLKELCIESPRGLFVGFVLCCIFRNIFLGENVFLARFHNDK